VDISTIAEYAWYEWFKFRDNPAYNCYEDDEVSHSMIPYIDDIKEDHDSDTYDQYVGAHVRVPIGDEIRSGKVLRRKRELDGTVMGASQCQPNARYKNLLN
jgi:hypothetical protein